MAKKPAINKTQAVRDYLKIHPKATREEVVAALTKQGIKINAGYVSNIKTQMKKNAAKAVAEKPAKASASTTAPAMPEKPTKNGDTITLEQIRAVARTVKTVGGTACLSELLGLIRELGGLKKFQDLVDAITVPEADDVRF